ncbi:MAG: hydrogenase [Candidatus Omnitrophica bacterium]|nr:hydrogenase [Candidatus Omnitrophota bacterium]
MMTTWINASCILVVFLALSILASYRMAGMIHLFAAQSLVVGLVPLFLRQFSLSQNDLMIVAITIVSKSFITPNILFWAIRHVPTRAEVKPLIGIGASLLVSALLIAVAFWVAASLQLPGLSKSNLVLPCSLAAVLLGFMLLVTRTRAISQVVGYLVMENGIFLFALSLFDAMPILIEMGILLDVFVAVFIMAIVVNHINEEFSRQPMTLVRSKMGENT